MFHYSAYWHCWSRVLSTSHPKGPFVEVNLTALGGDMSDRSWAQQVKPIRIRFHGTARERNDQQTETLPPEVLRIMVQKLGEELVNRLLTEDFLSQIDYDLYRQKCNGGANLADIKRPEADHA